MNQSITVYVVDDEPMERGSLSTWFTSLGFEAIGLSTDGLDIDSRPQSGLSVVLRCDAQAACGMIRFDRRGLPVIVTSDSFAADDLLRLIGVGAAGFVSRSSLRSESTEALIRRIAVDDQDVARARRESLESHQSLQSLTSRERLILRLVCEGRPTKWIANYLRLGTRTIETCRSAIVEKFKVETWSEVIAKVNRHLGFQHQSLAAIHSDAVPSLAGPNDEGPPHALETSES